MESNNAPALLNNSDRDSRDGASQQQHAKPSCELMKERSMVIPLPPEALTTLAQLELISGAVSFGIVTKNFMIHLHIA